VLLAPLPAVIRLGGVVATLALVGAAWVVFAKVSGRYVVSGWASLITLIAFLGGVQLIVLGVLGEYVWRTYMQVQLRPFYVVEGVALRVGRDAELSSEATAAKAS
jgi:dolichol-phosphate mannosyltransferase